MPLHFDEQFLAAGGDMFEGLLAASKGYHTQTIPHRRKVLAATFAAAAAHAPTYPDLVETVHSLTLRDGACIDILEISKASLSSTSLPPQSEGTNQASEGGGGRPAILHSHGGGMVLFSVYDTARSVRPVVQHTGISAFMVDYRLAPEHNGTSLVDDCYEGLLWLRARAKGWGIDESRIILSGESAGGGLALGLALRARDERLSPPIAKVVTVYPMIDDRNILPTPHLAPFTTWTAESNAVSWNALLGEGHENRDDISPYAAPARAQSYRDLPPVYMDTGSLDIFAHENLELAKRLLADDVDVEMHLHPGLPHAWELFGTETDVGRAAYARRLKAYTTV